MPQIPEHIATILSEEMDRKHFLQFSMAVMLAAFGVSGFISAMIASSKNPKSTITPKSRGYGSSRFGKS
jgi:hypothetical protein